MSRPGPRRCLLAAALCSALVLALAACDGDSGAGAPPGSPLPAELVGTWTSVDSTTAIDFYDTTTGSFSEPSFYGTALMFYDDSSYLMGDSWSVSSYGCSYKLASTQKGMAAIEGDLLHLAPNDGKWWTDHSCGPNDGGAETLVTKTYRFEQTDSFFLELWDTSFPDPDPNKGRVGAACTQAADCLGGYCLDMGGWNACSGHCSDAIGCTFLKKKDLTCGELWDCTVACNPGGDGYLYAYGNVQVCGDGCVARATQQAITDYNAIAACLAQSGCTDDACFSQACAGPLDTCNGPD